MHIRRASCALLLLLTACGSSGDPSPTPEPPDTGAFPFVLGDTVRGTLRASDSVLTLRYEANRGVDVVLYWRVLSGVAELEARQAGALLFQETRNATSSDLLALRTNHLRLEQGQALTLRFRHVLTPPAEARVQFLLREVDRRPETAAAAYTAGALVDRERLEHDADVDEFTLAAQAGESYVGFLDVDGSATTGASLALLPPGQGDAGPLFLFGASAGGATLEDNASVTATIPAAGTYRIAAYAPQGGAVGRPYRFRVRRVNPAPETARQVNAPGDSLGGERIDHIGDVDEFVVSGAAGQQVNLFYGGESGAWTGLLSLAAVGDGAPTIGLAAGQGLARPSTGRFTLPASGQVRLRVAPTGISPATRVGYWLVPYAVNPAPERVPSTLGFTQLVTGEAIDREGDVDEFTLTAAQRRLVNLELLRDDPGTASLSMRVLDALGRTVWPVAAADPSPTRSGRLTLEPGTYRVRLSGEDGGPTPWSTRVLGAYRLRSTGLDDAPEIAAPVIPLGVGVTDAIDPLGDRDTLAFDAVTDDVVRLTVSVPGDPASSGIGAYVRNPSTDPIATDYPRATPTRPGEPVELTKTRRYAVVVDAGDGTQETVRGAYTVRLDPVSTAPESAPASLAPGQALEEELAAYDIDEFTLTGPVGGEIVLVARMPGVAGPRCIELMNPITRARLGGLRIAVPSTGATPPLSLGTEGAIRASLWAVVEGAPLSCPADREQGRRGGPGGAPLVRLESYLVQRAPESAPVNIAVGQILTGETLSDPGDVDEFRLTVSSPRTVLVLPRAVGGGGTEPTVRIFRLDGTKVYDPAVSPTFAAMPGEYVMEVRPEFPAEMTGPVAYEVDLSR